MGRSHGYVGRYNGHRGIFRLGSPVFAPVESEELEETRKKLDNSRRELNKSSHKKASQSVWLKKFMNSSSEIEHEAFLALWLSRFVLPSAFQVVVSSVFSIAVHLARGTRIALGPAVLAKIYTDLSCLNRKIFDSTRLDSDCDDGIVGVALWSPLQLVQVWVWERFPGLRPRPRPNSIDNGEPRLALWHHLKCKVPDVRSVLDSAKESFEWCPYVNDVEFYGDTAKWISVDLSLDDELLSFARILRASELVGLDCIEQYLPHRVAIQFRMDQDIPGHVPRSNDSPEIAWADYNTPIAGGKLYIPSRVSEADVTCQYSNWWKQSKLNLQEGREDDTGSGFKTPPKNLNQSRLLKRKEKDNEASSVHGSALKRSKQSAKYPKRQKEACNASYVSRSSSMLTGPPLGSEVDKESNNETISSRSVSKPLKEESQLDFVIKKELNNSPFPPGFPPKGNMMQTKDSLNGDKVTATAPFGPDFAPQSSINENKANPTVPPGFPPKCNRVEVKGTVDVKDSDEGTVTIYSSSMNHGSVGSKVGGNHSESHPGSSSLDSDDEDQLTISEMLNSNMKIDDIDCLVALDDSSGQCSVADNELPRCELITTLGTTNAANEAAIDINNDCPNETPWLRLEKRISRLERLVTKTKAMLFGNI
ncbi:E3 ubiquitin-protein ligase ATL31-like [Hibiscus syriacus]|uniref:E3 ubiquitin-protein ligase ATL31-like n=1 Tax=Hibiscus syriacus TaxID=106335 RepID=A0A6A3AJV4_HIBSY|nr:E3 ubiquitin-protein ligase ATL31-like [Hibiscus syriacus]